MGNMMYDTEVIDLNIACRQLAPFMIRHRDGCRCYMHDQCDAIIQVSLDYVKLSWMPDCAPRLSPDTTLPYPFS